MKTYTTLKRLRTLAAAALCAALLLGGCAGADGGGLFGPDGPLSFLFGNAYDLENLRLSEDLPVYDLSPCIERESFTPVTAAVRGDGTLLILSLNLIDEYVLQSFDPETGAFEDLWNWKAESGTEFALRFLSVDPVVLYDDVGGILYRPDAAPDRYVLDADEQALHLFCNDGTLYGASSHGFVYRYDRRFYRELIWTLPEELCWMIPQTSVDDAAASYLTYSVYDSETALSLDLSLPDCSYTLHTVEGDPVQASAGGDGLLCEVLQGPQPAAALYDPAASRQKHLLLPASVREWMSSESLRLNADDACVSQQACLLRLEDSLGNLRHLLLWKHPDGTSQSWEAPAGGDVQFPSASYGELTQRAQELEETYGITILLGENVPQISSDYRQELCTDTERISDGLDMLAEALQMYPADYFRSMKGPYCRGFRICLCGDLTPTDPSLSISNAAGFSTYDYGVGSIVIDLQAGFTAASFVHECTHLTDYRLQAEGLLDEDAWSALNPEDFSYYYAYIDPDGNSYEDSGSAEYTAFGEDAETDPERIWFVDAYSKTYPMEDRARLMEYLVLYEEDSTPSWFSSPHLQEKAGHYLRLVRDALETDTWPAETIWEKRLREAGQ
ncbi:MAG: hypothetical protein IKG66_07495 [Lachnospiraceae bacterium]|nr:hypothetical protein [Lachnospiraceae bacterium]